MDLKTFFMGMSVADREAFATRCDSTSKHIYNVALGKTCGEDLAIAIEQESGGLVRCDTLRPDLKHRFDYLRGTKKTRKAA